MTAPAPISRTLDWRPLLLVSVLAALALPFVGSPATWATLTLAGLAMGMMIFIMASGLTLVFGLMDVLNFGHAAFITLGAYTTTLLVVPLAGWLGADSIALNLLALAAMIALAATLAGAAGFVFERALVRPVYGRHLHQICYFIVLVASYDLLLGYTGIVSFAHTMFFGIGAYGAGLALYAMGPTWTAIGLGSAVALVLSVCLALLIGLFSLRVRAIFFAMITLAVASVFAILASQLGELTGGEDGRTYQVPPLLRPGFRLIETEVFGVAINGRLIAYYLLFAASLGLFLVMLRIVNSPFGRVLQAIRENDFRAEALGYRVVLYRSLVTVVSAAMATAAGILCAVWLRYTGPAVTLSFDIMLDLLLMVVIGGMGTLYGAVMGATIFLLAESYLQTLMGLLSHATEGLPLLPQLFHPDRWLLWLGLLFIASVYFFPQGVVGKLRGRATGSA